MVEAAEAIPASEVKIEKFQLEHLGEMEFCPEATDRDVQKPREGPSIGALLRVTWNIEVVE